MILKRTAVLIAIFGFTIAIAHRATAQAVPAQAALQQHVAAYAAAWRSRDPARIAALHTEDTVFDLRVAGETPAAGRSAVQAQFTRILRDNPVYASTVGRSGSGPTSLSSSTRLP